MSTLTQCSQESVREGQSKLITRMITDVGSSEPVQAAIAALDKDGAERVKGNPEFVASIREFVIKKIAELSVTNQFADEEVASTYTYPKAYKGPKPIAEQITTLAETLGLDPSQALVYAQNLPPLPPGAEGWFAIPSVTALAQKHFATITDPAEQYCQAIQLVHQNLAASRSFTNYREGEITSTHLQVHVHTVAALITLAEQQPGDILIVAGQLGLRHRGLSVRRAREVFLANEAGMTSLMACSIALTHPERFVRSDELDVDCAGDQFAPDGDGVFSGTPYVYFSGELKFDAHDVGYPRGRFGSASFFLPQQ